ncbi:hypothetical protein SAMN05443429_106163 [Cruoricaptor ignavus]|uniref:Uncharacterized protein n=1 Tax=Cruoricaptor ignavus TaxID=1118202 RepID=A0A1M6FAL9_9FLAO|nr:hypothetical protein SAMN05443429_106163 [Cruoricaptor ignavus]
MVCSSAQAQYTKYSIRNIGTITISNDLEPRGGSYKKFLDEVSKQIVVKQDADRVVFQQKGLNEFTEKGFSEYVRVIIETEYGRPGDFEKSTRTAALPSSELTVLNNETRNYISQSFRGTGLKLLK